MDFVRRYAAYRDSCKLSKRMVPKKDNTLTWGSSK